MHVADSKRRVFEQKRCSLIGMKGRRSPPIRFVALLLPVALAALLISPLASFSAKAEDIPHENYDLVKSNLDAIIALLRTSITYSENALVRMYNESMLQVEENLTVVRGLLTPAERILERIRDIADSYENLSMLLPPFNSLSGQMDSFASDETVLLDARDHVASASQLSGLTGDDMLAAIESIMAFNSLINKMNTTIDNMLISANGIIGLVVEGNQPFTDNRLIPLIEQLRDLLHAIEAEFNNLVENGVPWNQNEPFSILWLSAGDYYLGDQIIGGGYLYFNGAFVSDHRVTILMDGGNLTSATTSSGGRYSFSYQIPLDASWLGTHVLQATSDTPDGPLDSESVTIRILLVPTSISLHVNSKLLRLEDRLEAETHLEDIRNRVLPDAPCYFMLDGQNIYFRTDALGDYATYWDASNLGYGIHRLQAFYVGELPYEPSASDVMTIIIDIPTTLHLNLFETRYFQGYYVVGNGTLVANGTAPMPGQDITLFIDGVVVQNVDDGTERGVFILREQRIAGFGRAHHHCCTAPPR